MALRINERFGDYRLLRFLGEGTFGDVYYGEHIYQHTPTAIKVFKTKLTPDKLKDFINEVRTVLLQHPNIVRILDFGIGDNDLPYLVMEYAPDGTLLQRHPRGTRLPLATVVTYVKQIASALQYAHDQRRIHRDVKPENILLGASNQVLLSDFGLAVVAHSPVSQRTEDKSGTALYMAPEQWQGKPLPATDQYALAIIVYEWLCGESPFVGNGLQLMYQHIYTAPAPLRSKVSTLSPEVEQVVMTALAKDPQRRFRNIQAFATALEQAMQPRKKPTGTLLWSYRSNTASMESLAWSPDSIYIASANAKECHIWNINHPNDHKILPFGANTLTWIQDGRRIGIKQKNKMLLADVKTGDILSEIAVPFLPPDDEPDRDHTWSPNGVYISYTDGHTAPPLVLLDVEKTAQTYFDRNVFIHCWSPDGNFLAYIRANVVVLDTRTGSKRRLDNVFKGNIELAIFTICLSLSPTAALIAIENIADPNMQIWDVSTATCIFTQSLPKEESYRGYPLYPRSPADRQLVWSPSCKYLARKVRKEVQIWDIGAKQQIFSYQRHANTVLCVAWSPDGTCIASTDVDGVVHVWQAPS